MEQACGWLRWTPQAFWDSTLDEVSAAVHGYAEARGVKKSGGDDDEQAKWERLYRLGREAAIAEQQGAEYEWIG